jgi:glycosyltransferase involved in cell wall biosynthesis
VTVTVPATGLRYAKRIEACFESIWSQQGLPEGSEVETLLVWQSAEDPPAGVQVVVAQPDRGPFCLARSRNIGLRAATHDLVAFTDADIVFHPELLARAVARVRASECFVTCLTVMLPEGREAPHIAAHGYGGFLLAPREDLVEIGGYDEAYVGWGVEDNDLVDRLVWYGLEHVCLTESDGVTVEHQWHPEGTRNRTFLDQNRKRYWSTDSILRNQDEDWGALSLLDERMVS